MFVEQYGQMDYNKKVFHNYSTITVMPLVYIAPALGIISSKIFAHVLGIKMVSTVYMLYFARIFSLILAIFLTACAIKITPVMKKTFLVVSLIPMTLFLNSMVSYDSVLIPSSLLALAIILDVSYSKKKIETKDIIILSLIGTVLLNVKTVYFLLYILMFIIPVKKFGNKKDKIKTALKIVGLILLLTLIIQMPTYLHNLVKTDSLAKQQLSFILINPFKYFGILLQSIVGQRSFYINTTIGSFGLIDTYLPIAVLPLIAINLLILGIAEGSIEKIKIGKWMKIFVIIFVIFCTIGIYTALYIVWTPQIAGKIGSNEITGVQGRYFLPLIMPLLLLFCNIRIKDNKFFKIVRDNYLLIPIISLVVSLCMVFMRFW